MANPWDADPIIAPAPARTAPAAGNPWDDDPIIQSASPAVAAEPEFDPNAGMSWSDKLFVGMGRGAAGVYQGAKQLGLQAGEGLGFVDPGTADAYTKKVQAEHELYDRYSSGLGIAGKIGEFAGSAMAVPVPGVGAGAGLLGRLGGAAAMGAGQGALEFVPEGESRANNALVGGLAGLAGQTLIGEPLRGGLRRLASLAAGGTPNITGNAANALAYANERNLPLYYDDIAGSRGARALGTFTDDLPLLGTGRTRKAQSEAAGAAAQSIADRFQQQAPGRVADSLKESAERQLARARGLKNELYRTAFQQLNALGEFDLPKTRAMAKRIIEHNQKKGTLADPTVIAELQRYADAPTFNFEGWHGARSELGGTIHRQMSGENAILSDASTAQLRTLKGIMDAELREVASKAGDSAATAWRRADNFYRTAMPKYKRGVVADLLKSKNPDAIADKILDGKDSEGIARQVYQALDRGGRADVRSALLSRAMERATVVNPDGGEYFSPAVFAKELERVQNRTAAFFKKEDRLEIEGLRNYMQFVKQAGSYAANPPTGKRLLPHLALLAGSGAIGPKALAAYGSVAGVSRLLLRTKLGRNMLLRMGSVSPTSKAAAETAQAINAFLQRALASEGTKALEIDIVGGTPGPAPTVEELERLRAGR